MRLQDLLVALAAGWRWIVFTAAGLAIATVGINLLLPRHYTSSASFVPNAAGGLSSLATIASDFGVSLPGDNGGLSSQFYADFMSSDQVVKWAISPDTIWGTSPSAIRPDLLRKLNVSDDNPLQLQATAVRKVKGMLNISVDPISLLVRLDVTSKDASLSAAIAARLLNAVELFNSASRKLQARAEAEFTEARTVDARRALDEAEGRMADFVSQNREWGASPRLTVEYDRLTQELGFARSNYGALVQALEQARLQAVHDDPLITRVESPVPAGVPDRRYSILKGLAAGFAGALLAIALICSKVLLRGIGEANPDLRAAWNRLWAEVRATARLRRRKTNVQA